MLEKPVKPPANSDEVDIDVYDTELEQFVKDKRKLRLSLKSLYSVIWGQCSNSMVIKLTSIEDQKKWKKDDDCGNLLQAIKQIVMKFEHKKHPVVSLLQQLRNFYSYRQRENHDIHRYYETFQLMVENIESFGGEIGVQPMFLASYYKLDNLSQDDVALMSNSVQEAYIYKAKERSLAIMFILNARQDIYGQLTTDLENRFLLGHDDFPKTTTEAYDMLSNYKTITQSLLQINAIVAISARDSLSFNTQMRTTIMNQWPVEMGNCSQMCFVIVVGNRATTPTNVHYLSSKIANTNTSNIRTMTMTKGLHLVSSSTTIP